MYKPVPARVDFPALEREILRFWQERQVFDKLVARNRGGERFSFIDGPITANNPMGVHHAWGRTYKDIYQRFKAMKGFDQRYQNGFDCQGLWVEVEVERALGLNSKRQIEEYGLERFVEQCRERVLTFAEVITQQSIRLGQWMDWANSYYTMSDNNIEHIWAFLKRCHENGWLYRGWRTMPWCARCGTSLSQHELIGTDSYREVTHPSVYLRLPIAGRLREYFLVWTTTPWTLPANVALAVHPDLPYARVQVDGDTYYLSAKVASGVFAEAPAVATDADKQFWPLRAAWGDNASQTGTVMGRDLIGWRYRGPFAELPAQAGVDHRVVPWEDVGEEEGTGIVHIAPGCGAEDFTLGQLHGLPVLVPIDENGDYYEGFGPLSGRNVSQVDDEIFASLAGKGMLHQRGLLQHRYPTCWRCGEQIVFRAVSEWFISAEQIRPRMIHAARTVEWTPPSALKRMEDWLNNMLDWCISRKRYWGLPLPFYPCQKCHGLTVVGSMDELGRLAVSGMEGLRELHRPWIDQVRIRCPQCGTPTERVTEVGDCWLDAGIVPFSTLGAGYLGDRDGWARWYPADWVSEMREQIRLWFYSMLFMSVTLEGRSPYQRVLTYEKLMDEAGRPMHKSYGNAIWFDEAAERMGADVMRWLYAGQNLQTNLLFGYGPAEEVRRKLLTLWNVYSFYVTYANTVGFAQGPAPLRQRQDSPRRMDRWILSQLNQLVALANDRLGVYDVAALVDAVDRFVESLSTWYLRRGRRRFSRAAPLEERNAAFSTLHECLVTLARLVAPVMPFLAEELYQNLVRSHDAAAPESVHLTPYPAADDRQIDPDIDGEMELVQAIVTLGRAARSEAGIRVRQPLQSITIASEMVEITLSDELRREIADELNVKAVKIAHNVEAFARRVVRPKPRLLGPRLGREFPSVSRALEQGDYAIQPDGSVRVGEHTLRQEEVTITLEPRQDQAVAQDLQLQGRLAVALDRTITAELRGEGRVRELVHRVQTMRREAGLSVEDRISVGYRASPEWRKIMGIYGPRIREDVGAVEIHELGGRGAEVEEPDGSPGLALPEGRGEANVAPQVSWEGVLDGEEILLTLRAARRAERPAAERE